MAVKNILNYETVALDDEKSTLVIIDQTKLPGDIQILELKRQSEIWNAIYKLEVRGAPAIGIAGAMGLYLAAKEIATDDFEIFYQAFQKAKDYLDSARPTAVNLSWALKRMEQVVIKHQTLPIGEIKEWLRKEAISIKAEDTLVCKMIGEYALSLVKPGDGLLTHCNAGQLATSKYGTATALMYLGQEKGYNFKIFADETRPLLQGARLTAFELQSAGLDVTLICDNMASSVMQKGWVQAVFVGCDRVAANGDTANKIGTSGVGILAQYYGVPMYICAPTSTIDMNCQTGADIHIEERPSEEITQMWYKQRMAPEGVKTYNPCFDVTDHSCITAIVTEYGIARPPFETSLKTLFEKKAESQKDTIGTGIAQLLANDGEL